MRQSRDKCLLGVALTIFTLLHVIIWFVWHADRSSVHLYDNGNLYTRCNISRYRLYNGQKTIPTGIKNIFHALKPPQATSTNCVTGTIMRAFKTHNTKTQLKKVAFENGLSNDKRKDAFVGIYNKRSWAGADGQASFQRSGPGSNLAFAQEAIAVLHSVVDEYKVLTGRPNVRLLDVPCGDMQWMERFLETHGDVEYTGMDIVPDIIQHHQHKYHLTPWTFIQQDIVKTPLTPDYDIIHCRMMMQHLPINDVIKVLNHISSSNASYMIATTYPWVQINRDINPGSYHPYNLELPPFSLAPPLCYHRDGYRGKHYLGVWRLPLEQAYNCNRINSSDLVDMCDTTVMYSCI